jgi:hypothetical protein
VYLTAAEVDETVGRVRGEDHSDHRVARPLGETHLHFCVPVAERVTRAAAGAIRTDGALASVVGLVEAPQGQRLSVDRQFANDAVEQDGLDAESGQVHLGSEGKQRLAGLCVEDDIALALERVLDGRRPLVDIFRLVAWQRLFLGHRQHCTISLAAIVF